MKQETNFTKANRLARELKRLSESARKHKEKHDEAMSKFRALVDDADLEVLTIVSAGDKALGYLVRRGNTDADGCTTSDVSVEVAS